ncbi:hypothetical protein P9112_010535 [Eukaryota sp. TZLM1-RC]
MERLFCYFIAKPWNSTVLLDKTMKILQSNYLPLNKVRDLFLIALQNTTEVTEKYLTYPNEFMETPIFEMAVIKILDGDERDMGPEERDSVEFLLKQHEPERKHVFLEPDDIDGHLQELEARRRLPKESRYHDLSFIPGSSSQVERLFSLAKYVCEDRFRLSSKMLNIIMMLKFHGNRWDDRNVREIVRYRRNSGSFRQERDDQDDCIFDYSIFDV